MRYNKLVIEPQIEFKVIHSFIGDLISLRI